MSGPTLEHEAQPRMTLDELLKKERPPETRRAVQEVLDSDLKTSEKIAKIQQLDDATERAYDEPPKPSDSVDEMKAKAQLWQPLRYSLAKLKAIIKLPHNSVALFPFLFVQYRRIKEYGRKTHVFSPTFLLPVLRLDKSVPDFLTGSLQEWADRLVLLLTPAIENGWKILTKREYNMIAALRKLCTEIVATNFRILNYRDRYLIDRLRNLEALFFVFHYREDYPQSVAENVSRALLADGEHDDEAEEAEILVKSILFRGFSLPSLYDLLLGMNMMKFRQHLSHPELIASDLGEVFNSIHFACDPRIQHQIDEAAGSLQQAVMRLESHLRHIRRVREYLPTREQGQPDDALLEEFHEFGSSQTGANYLEDRDNIVLFVPQFLQRLDEAYGPLLGGTVNIEELGPAAIFDPQVFDSTIDHFHRLSYRLEQLSFNYRTFAYERYIGIRREGRGTIALESEIVTLLRETLGEISTLGKNLAIILEKAVETETEDGQLRPVDAHALKQAAIEIPHAKRNIVAQTFVGGRSVWQSLQILVSLCFLMASYLYDDEIADLRGSENATRQKIASQLYAYARLSDDAAYRDLLTQIVGVDQIVPSPPPSSEESEPSEPSEQAEADERDE